MEREREREEAVVAELNDLELAALHILGCTYLTSRNVPVPTYGETGKTGPSRCKLHIAY
jgi:hypothetical protein